MKDIDFQNWLDGFLIGLCGGAVITLIVIAVLKVVIF